MIQEVEEFLSFCDLENREIFTMRFVAGFSFNSVEFRTGVSRKTFSRRVEAWLEKYNEIRDYR